MDSDDVKSNHDSDPDYDPDAQTESSEEEEDDDYEDDLPQTIVVITQRRMKKPHYEDEEEDDEESDNAPTTTTTTATKEVKHDPDKDVNNFIKAFTKVDDKYWTALPSEEREKHRQAVIRIKNPDGVPSQIPLRFKVLQAEISPSAKELILSKIDQFNTTPVHSGEYHKLRNWISALEAMPITHFKALPVTANDPKELIAHFLEHVRRTLDDTVYGHGEAKDQILRIIAQWVSNPKSKGHCIGICGSMGVGKTSIIKDGLSKALGLPFSFITLGGASDGSILEGHNYTYEGSSYGKICEVLMKAKCMNPIIFFDELDKVSTTSRGEEISNILTHLTDSTQNDHFTDRYFGDIEFDLSKALMIFSYNDESLINPILKDRMITIRVPGYSLKDKIVIAKNYLLPKILSQYQFNAGDIVFPDATIEDIVNKLPSEEGVRGLKRGMESIVSWLNMYRYIPPLATTAEGETSKKRKRIYDNLVFPLEVNTEHVDQLLSKSELDAKTRRNEIISTMYL
jgi:ATP-dependent Lon protease